MAATRPSIAAKPTPAAAPFEPLAAPAREERTAAFDAVVAGSLDVVGAAVVDADAWVLAAGRRRSATSVIFAAAFVLGVVFVVVVMAAAAVRRRCGCHDWF